ncbi:MAG TPA: hypothetical protein VGF20_05280 [Candidatus Acidoferrum sp.]
MSLLTLTTALYLSVGSWMFPGWFYGFLWDTQFTNLSYWRSGVSYWLDDHTDVLIIAVIAIFILLGLIVVFRKRFFQFVDLTRYWLTSIALLALVLTLILVRENGRSEYELMVSLESLTTNMKVSIQQLWDIGKPPKIETPIDFQYLDTARVESLYNQIEPDLIERKRTVNSEKSIEGKSKVGTDAASAEIGAEKKAGATSSFERADFTPFRKCEEVMSYVLEQKRASYYTDGVTWITAKSFEDLKAQLSKSLDSRSPLDLKKLELQKSPQETAAMEKQEQLQFTIRETALEAELSGLRGLVFVEGDFKIGRPGDGEILLEEPFLRKPRSIVIRVTGINAKDMAMLKGKTHSHLRIFGSVTEPLRNDGRVEIRAIAAF